MRIVLVLAGIKEPVPDGPWLCSQSARRGAPIRRSAELVRELMNDDKAVAAAMRKAHKPCDEHEDVATARLLETFIDAIEKRTWFLFESARKADGSGH